MKRLTELIARGCFPAHQVHEKPVNYAVSRLKNVINHHTAETGASGPGGEGPACYLLYRLKRQFSHGNHTGSNDKTIEGFGFTDPVVPKNTMWRSRSSCSATARGTETASPSYRLYKIPYRFLSLPDLMRDANGPQTVSAWAFRW